MSNGEDSCSHEHACLGRVFGRPGGAAPLGLPQKGAPHSRKPLSPRGKLRRELWHAFLAQK